MWYKYYVDLMILTSCLNIGVKFLFSAVQVIQSLVSPVKVLSVDMSRFCT